MNKKMPYIIAGTASLVALVSIGSAISMSSRNEIAEAEILALQTQIARMQAIAPEVKTEHEIVYLTDNSDTSEINALKTQLAEKDARIRELQSDASRPAQRIRAVRQSFEESMAQMREENPEGYSEMIQRRSERQQEMRDNLDERNATFMDVDTARMTEAELASHELLVAKMAQLGEITERFQDPETVPDHEAMWEMMGVAREVQPLLEIERSIMLKQLGNDLGYEGKDAEVFANHVEDIIEATSMQIPAGRPGRLLNSFQ